MKKRTLLAAVIVASTLFTVSAVIYAQAQKPAQTSTTTVQSVPLNATTIFTLVNAERTKAGLKPLVRDTRLDSTALTKVNDMVDNNYFGHVSPASKLHGYELIPTSLCTVRSENIGYSSGPKDNNRAQIEWWMSSKAHHDAILNADYTTSGVAVNEGKVVQHFCVSR